jgi:hypothetical protein
MRRDLIAYSTISTGTPPELFRFDICGEVDSAVPENPQGVITKRIPGGRCARVRHISSTDRIGESVYPLYRKWLPESGEELRDFFYNHLPLPEADTGSSRTRAGHGYLSTSERTFSQVAGVLIRMSVDTHADPGLHSPGFTWIESIKPDPTDSYELFYWFIGVFYRSLRFLVENYKSKVLFILLLV